MNDYLFSVADRSSGQALQGATLMVNGKPVGSSDNVGYVEFQANPDDMVTVSYIGYDPYSIPAGQVEQSGIILLSRKNSPLPAVTVTPGIPSGLGQLTPWLLVAGFGVLALSSAKKKRMSGVKSSDNKTILILALVGGAVYLFTRPKSIYPTYPAGSYPPTPVYQGGQTTNPLATASSWLSAGSGLFNQLKDLFGGSSAPDLSTPALADTGSGLNQPISPAAEFPTIGPSSGYQFDFPSVDPGVDTSSIPFDISTISGIRKMGDLPADTFSVSEIIGKTLIANVSIPVYEDASDSAQPVGYVNAGQPVGVVSSWLDPSPTEDRSELWWVFNRPNDFPYYVKHGIGLFNISSLQQQGVLTDVQQAQAAAGSPWYETLIKKYGPWVLGGVVVLGLGKEVIKKHL